jgi:hypothetical protein
MIFNMPQRGLTGAAVPKAKATALVSYERNTHEYQNNH